MKKPKFLSSLIVSSIILCLTACGQPTMNTPGVSSAELQQEQELQRQYSAEHKLEKQEKYMEQTAKMQARLNKVFAPIARSGAKVCAALYAGEGAECVFAATVQNPKEGEEDDPKGVNAFADGERIVVNRAMMSFARDDNELAFVLAHELAHNILRHPQSSTNNAMLGMLAGTLVDVLASSQGYSTGGAFGDIGANAAVLHYSSDFEAEADYVGMYILAGAGGDYKNAANFWRRMSVRDSRAIYLSTTHPSNPERFVAMQKTAGEITAKKQNREALLPDRKVEHEQAADL